MRRLLSDENFEKGKYWGRAWSLVRGCTEVSAGCMNCWSRSMLERFHPRANWRDVQFNSHTLDLPLRKIKQPSIWSIWNDLFHPSVAQWQIHEAMHKAQMCPEHVFIALTKRSERFAEIEWDCATHGMNLLALTNFILGVTAENQEQADRRIPLLLETPAWTRMVSVEPMLGPVDLRPWLGKIGWVIVGAETGTGRRECREEWIESIVNQCRNAGVPCWVKAIQIGGDVVNRYGLLPRPLRVRQMPTLY